MRTQPWTSTAPEMLDLELIDDEPFEPSMATAGLLSGLEASLDDIEPWQRLGDLLGSVTGEAETD